MEIVVFTLKYICRLFLFQASNDFQSQCVSVVQYLIEIYNCVSIHIHGHNIVSYGSQHEDNTTRFIA